MRVLVCGGRDFGVKPDDRRFMYETLREEWEASREVEPNRSNRYSLEIISGMATGADSFAAEFAHALRLKLHPFPADWKAHGRAAGPIRNQRMIDEGKPDLVIAFPGGRGTADMVRRARAAGIEVREVSPRPQHGGGAE